MTGGVKVSWVTFKSPLTPSTKSPYYINHDLKLLVSFLLIKVEPKPSNIPNNGTCTDYRVILQVDLWELLSVVNGKSLEQTCLSTDSINKYFYKANRIIYCALLCCLSFRVFPTMRTTFSVFPSFMVHFVISFVRSRKYRFIASLELLHPHSSTPFSLHVYFI